jgi:hypothetical protein
VKCINLPCFKFFWKSGCYTSAVTISCGQYHNFSSFLGSTREVDVLWMLHSFTHFVSQNSQSFSGCLSHAYPERPPRCGSLDHLVDASDMICHRLLIDDHTHIKGMSSYEVASRFEWRVGTHYIPVPGVVSAGSSGSSQHADHRYGTP